MRFENVVIAGIDRLLPEESVTSERLEERLGPVYERLHLSTGRLELMTGIRERRFFPPGTRPSSVAAGAGRLALSAANEASAGRLTREDVGCLIHASVCRDFLEPATASVVHDALELGPHCSAYDLSNACLGFANAMTVLAQMIEFGSIRAGLVVAGEDGRPLVEETVAELTRNESVGKQELKRAFASLTIGSGAAAAVLCHRELCPGAPRLLGGAAMTASEHHVLCHGDHQGSGLWMETDSEALLVAGNALARRTFEQFLAELGWERGDLERTITHQVGAAHRRLLFESLELDTAIDFPTVGYLGNMGSVSLPATLCEARDADFLGSSERIALLGIGSGLQCAMLGVTGAGPAKKA